MAETLTDFITAAQFVAAKGEYLSRYESRIPERAKKVIVRLFRDGPSGVAAGLSAAKWMRMTKVSKATATRDLADLAEIGAIVPVGTGPVARYAINGAFSNEPIEGLNEGINGNILKLVRTHPGVRIPYLHSVVSASRATVERVVAALIAEGKIEHRGSKKTGGYYPLRGKGKGNGE